MRIFFCILTCLVLFFVNTTAQNKKILTINPPPNFIDYSTYPRLNEALKLIHVKNRDYPFVVISKLSCEEVNNSLKKDTIGEEACKFYNFYRVSTDNCVDCNTDESKRYLFQLLLNTNRFIKISNNWVPVIFVSDYDNDFYLAQYHNSFTGQKLNFNYLYKNQQSVIISIEKSSLRILKVD